jgi:hypothetical protein
VVDMFFLCFSSRTLPPSTCSLCCCACGSRRAKIVASRVCHCHVILSATSFSLAGIDPRALSAGVVARRGPPVFRARSQVPWPRPRALAGAAVARVPRASACPSPAGVSCRLCGRDNSPLRQLQAPRVRLHAGHHGACAASVRHRVIARPRARALACARIRRRIGASTHVAPLAQLACSAPPRRRAPRRAGTARVRRAGWQPLMQHARAG